MTIHPVYIGLGSNLGDSKQILIQAISALECFSPVTVSCFYGSKPHGPQNQPNYINAVAEVYTSLSPEALLRYLHTIEQSHNRSRKGVRWGARTLDLDILLYANQVIDYPHLVIPHRQMLNREFVLYPLFEIVPNLVLPNKKPLINYIDTAFFKRLISQPKMVGSKNETMWLLE